MSLVYWLSKFSHEALLVELFLIGCVSLSYFGYLLVQKRRYGVNKKQIPDHIIRAFLIELLSYSEGFKNQLFGEDLKITAGAGLTQAAAGAPLAASDGADTSALKSALAAAVTKQSELQKLIDALTKDKTALEAKVAAGGKAAPAASGADPKALADAMDKIAKLESKLAEYEVIEDDLANLKKYQQENKQLKAQLEGKGGAAPAVAAAPEPVAAAPEPAAAAAAAPEPAAAVEEAAAAEPTPVAAAEESAATDSAAANFDRLVDKVEESLATPAGASAIDPAAAAQAQTAAPVVETPAAPPAPEPAAAAPAPAAAPAAAPKEAPRDKSDADLLNEFERMLSS